MSKIALLGVISIAILGMTGCGLEITIGMQIEATATHQETIALDAGAPVALDVRNGVGAVTVRGAETDAIDVEYTFTAYGATEAEAERELAAMTVSFTHEAGRVEIDAVQPPRPQRSRANKVDLTITVPRTLDLVVRNGVGDVRANDLQTLDQLVIADDVGDIMLRNVSAGSNTSIKGNVGNIRFEGTLADAGSAEITTDVGKVIVRLPENAGAELEASTEVGSIAMRGLMASHRDLKKHIPGATLTATLGTGGPALTLNANVGDITLEQQQ